MTRSRSLLVSMWVAGLIAAGCSGSDDTDDTNVADGSDATTVATMTTDGSAATGDDTRPSSGAAVTVADDTALDGTAPASETTIDVTTSAGGDSTAPSDTAAAEANSDAVCAELSVAREAATGFGELVDESVADVATDDEAGALEALSDLADELRRLTPELLGAYDAAADEASGSLADDITTLSDGTEVLLEALIDLYANAESIDDLAALNTMFNEPEMTQVAQDTVTATLRINEFTSEECGFLIDETT